MSPAQGCDHPCYANPTVVIYDSAFTRVAARFNNGSALNASTCEQSCTPCTCIFDVEYSGPSRWEVTWPPNNEAHGSGPGGCFSDVTSFCDDERPATVTGTYTANMSLGFQAVLYCYCAGS